MIVTKGNLMFKRVLSLFFTTVVLLTFSNVVYSEEVGKHVDPTPAAQQAADQASKGFFDVNKSYSTDLIVGYEDAPITVIEYGSLTCPHCAYFETHVFNDFKKTFIDTHKVRFVYRHFPLDQLAALAAASVSCLPAAEQLVAISALYETQDKPNSWVKANNFNDGIGKLFSSLFGSNYSFEKISPCLKDAVKFRETMLPSFEARQANVVTGTPFFFINGKPYMGDRTIDGFSKAFSG